MYTEYFLRFLRLSYRTSVQTFVNGCQIGENERDDKSITHSQSK